LNPLLGKYPSDTRIVASCAVGVAATWLVGEKKWLPRVPFYLSVTAISGVNAAHNRFNLGFYFPF